MWPKMKHFQNMVTPPHSEVIENEKRTCPHRMLVNMFKETKLTQRLLILSKGFVENIFWVSWIHSKIVPTSFRHKPKINFQLFYNTCYCI